MLLDLQKQMLANIMQQVGIDGIKHIFAVAYTQNDIDTITYIKQHYAQHVTAEELSIMQDCIDEVQAIIADTINTATVH